MIQKRKVRSIEVNTALMDLFSSMLTDVAVRSFADHYGFQFRSSPICFEPRVAIRALFVLRWEQHMIGHGKRLMLSGGKEKHE